MATLQSCRSETLNSHNRVVTYSKSGDYGCWEKHRMWTTWLIVMKAQTPNASLIQSGGWRNKDKSSISETFTVGSVRSKSGTSIISEVQCSPPALPPFLPNMHTHVLLFPEGRGTVCAFHSYKLQDSQFLLQKARWYFRDPSCQTPTYCPEGYWLPSFIILYASKKRTRCETEYMTSNSAWKDSSQ